MPEVYKTITKFKLSVKGEEAVIAENEEKRSDHDANAAK